MLRPWTKVIVLSFVVGYFSTSAFAGVIGVGELTFDFDTPSALAAFDITNLTATDAFPPDFPISTPITITVTNLVAYIQGGGTVTIDGSDFTVVDAQGDVDCTVAGDAGSGGCDLSAYNLVSATLTGTLNPTSGLDGLPGGTTGIVADFTTVITPNAGCGPNGDTSSTLTAGCDAAEIDATGIEAAGVPEPSTTALFATGLFGLVFGYRRFRSSDKIHSY